HHGCLGRPGEPHAVVPTNWPLEKTRHVGYSRLHDRAVIEAHLVDREVAEIADVRHLAGDAILPFGQRRRMGDAHLLGPQRHPHDVAWLYIRGRKLSQPPGYVTCAPRSRRTRLQHAALEQVDL